jgi:hypothetical protein
LAIIAAGIEPAAIPKIIKVIGKVAKEGSLAISLDNIPPMKTMMGPDKPANGCAMKSSQIFLGKAYILESTSAEINNIAIVINMLIRIVALMLSARVPVSLIPLLKWQ